MVDQPYFNIFQLGKLNYNINEIAQEIRRHPWYELDIYIRKHFPSFRPEQVQNLASVKSNPISFLREYFKDLELDLELIVFDSPIFVMRSSFQSENMVSMNVIVMRFYITI